MQNECTHIHILFYTVPRTFKNQARCAVRYFMSILNKIVCLQLKMKGTISDEDLREIILATYEGDMPKAQSSYQAFYSSFA